MKDILVNNKVHSFMLMTVAYFAQFLASHNKHNNNNNGRAATKICHGPSVVETWNFISLLRFFCVEYNANKSIQKKRRDGENDQERSATAKFDLRIVPIFKAI